MPVKTPIRSARIVQPSRIVQNSRPVSVSRTSMAPAKVPADEPPILFQKYFKSVGPRTYAAQIKQARNGNHFLVLTEGKRDPKTEEIRKSRVFLYSEDFTEFFRMLHETAQWIRGNPVPAAVKAKREKFWTQKNNNRR